MAGFVKNLEPDFVATLERLAHEDSWWATVLADPTLIIACRGKHVNVYWQGQSLFDIRYDNGSLTVSTHEKYLLDPSLSGQVQLVAGEFAVQSLVERAFMRRFDAGVLRKMKQAALPYSQNEKCAVHTVVSKNNNVVDVEVVFVASPGTDNGKLPRADIATFERFGNSARLVLWEAKGFWNGDLRAEGEPKVLGQIRKYQDEMHRQRSEVIASYVGVAKNLVSIANMSNGARQLDPLIKDVAEGHIELVVSETPDVGLIIFGFDAAQKSDPAWKVHLEKLTSTLGKARVKAAGDPKNVRL